MIITRLFRSGCRWNTYDSRTRRLACSLYHLVGSIGDSLAPTTNRSSSATFFEHLVLHGAMQKRSFCFASKNDWQIYSANHCGCLSRNLPRHNLQVDEFIRYRTQFSSLRLCYCCHDINTLTMYIVLARVRSERIERSKRRG
jgi:hypothetical protein